MIRQLVTTGLSTLVMETRKKAATNLFSTRSPSVPVFLSEEGPGCAVPALVQRGSRGDFSGRRVICISERSEEGHTITAGLPGEPC